LVLAGVILAGRYGVWARQTASDPNPSALGDMTLHIVPQSHIDLAWWWRYDPETVQVIAKHTLETAFGNMEQFPDYTFTYLQVPAIEPLETLYPDLFYKLRYYVHNSKAIGQGLPNPGAGRAQGRLAIGSAAWCEFDGCVPCGESLVRQFVYGKRYFLRQFGVDVKTAWVQDAWTHPWTLPQILKKCGIDSYMFSRPRGQGEQMFWWESPDGSRVFAYKPFDVEGESLPSQERVNRRLLEMSRRYGVRDDITLAGVGNHGGGALRADIERMRRLMAQRSTQPSGAGTTPSMIFSTPDRFVKAVLANPHHFPVVDSELEPSIRGSYTTVGEIKKGNRRSESLLMTLERFSAIAAWLGQRPYPQTTIFDLWKKVMLNQFHDVISGTDILPGTDDALRLYQQVGQTGQAELDACLNALCERIDTAGPGTPIVVFNPLAWERTDALQCEVRCDASPVSIRLTDRQGNRLAAQIIGDRMIGGKHVVTIAFVAGAVPSLGYKSYWVAFGQHPDPAPASPKSSAREIENAYFRVQIDPATGCLRSVFDKDRNREVLAATGKGNLIQVLEDFGDSEGFLKSADGVAEHNDWTGRRCWDVDAQPRIALVERGPVRTVVQVRKKFGLARFTQRITLYAGIRRVDFDLALDWKGRNRMVKVSFPLAVSSPEAAYEIPYGVILRPSQGEEHAAQQWVDISAGDYGVSLLNAGRYGFDVTRNTIRMSVLRSPTEPVFTTDEADTHEVKYALFPHPGSWQGAGVVRQGYELNTPLIAVLDAPHGGDLPAAYSFVQVQPANVIMTVLKKAEDSNSLVMRCYEAEGKAGVTRVTLAAPLSAGAVHGSDLLENDERELSADASGFAADTPAYSIDTFKLYSENAP
jgi:alpha-mannosidase